MDHKYQNIELGNIYLDNDNPRHDPIANEKQIIQYLLENEDIKPLARDIVEAGGTSPLEIIALAPHPKATGKYIPAEGNRRICAMKLLADPDKADTEANKKYFNGLKAGLTVPLTLIRAAVFTDKEAARRWVSLRHEGPQGGIGTKQWNPQQKERFSRLSNGKVNPNTQASLLLDLARNRGLLQSSELDKLSLTTLTRFLTNPVFRDMLGLQDNRSLKITVPIHEFLHAVKRFLTDALTAGSGVNSRTSVDERRDYAAQLRNEGVAPTTRSQTPVDINSLPSPAAKLAPATAVATRRNNRSRDQDKYVIPSDFKAHIKNPILKRLFDELRTLPAEEFPFAAAYLFRAVIEKTAVLFLKQTQKGVAIPEELHTKLLRMADVLNQQGMSDSQLKPLRVMASDKDSRHSADTLGHFVHGGSVPSRMDSIKSWDSIQPVMAAALEQLK